MRRALLSTSKSTERIGASITIALHAVVVAALLSYEPARSALLAAAPVMVSLIVPPRVEPRPEPPVEIPPPPKPRPRVKAQPKPEPLPVLTVPLEVPAPTPIVVPPPPPPPPPEPAPVVVAPPAPPAPIAVTPPIFAADYLDNPAPRYPPASERNGEQGRVLLRVLVNAAGTADEVQIHTSSKHARLDEAARDTVRRWRFVPAKRGDQPVAAWVLIPISFRLER
jgi:periplasmic protein TonB